MFKLLGVFSLFLLIFTILGVNEGKTQSSAPPILPNNSLSQPNPPIINSPQVPFPPPPPIHQGFILPPDILSKAPLAIDTARAAKPFLSLGPIWVSRAPAGELIIKVALLYQKAAIGILEFDPHTGEILPRGYHPQVYDQKISLEKIKELAEKILPELTVLPGAEFRTPEVCWVIPLAYQGKIVSKIKIFYDALHVVPDYPLEAEIQWHR